VYGPLFTWISILLQSVVKSPSSLINGFQVLAAAASLGTLAILARLVDRVRPERAVFAVAVVGLNPIVVYHVVGGGHNDMLVALFISAAVALLFARKELLCAIALGLAVSVKASAAIPLVLLLVAVVAQTPRARRWGVLLRTAGITGAIWLVFALPFLQLQNPTLGIVEVSGHDSGKAPGQAVVTLFGGVGRLFGGSQGADMGAVIGRLSLFAMAIAVVALIARRIWTDPEARRPAALAAAWGWAMLLVVLLSPILGAWYLAWILPIAWTLPRVARRSVVILSVAFVVTELVTESSRLPDLLRGVDLPIGHPIAVAVLVWLAMDLARRLRRGIPFDAETSDRVFGDRFETGPAIHHPRPARVGSPLAIPSPAMHRH
jgi:alpha-1,6-mannosyltransferase